MTDQWHFADEPVRTVRPNGQAAPAEPTLFTIDWPSRAGLTPPERDFIVEDWLPTGVTTSLYGVGGVGKTMLAQLLGSYVAGGRLFFGKPTMQAPVLGVFCEDDDNELWRRQCRINDPLNLSLTDLGGFAAQGRLGLPNLLMTFPKGKPPEVLPLLAEIEARARATGARLIILDNVAQLFGGEENSRADVTAFINALNGLARRLDAAVLILGHPPKNAAEYSGSTAWHAAVRCMWTLTRVVEKEKDGEPSDGLMILTRFKANYAANGEEIRLRWEKGVLRGVDPDLPMSAVDASYHRHNAKLAFLAALDELTAQQRSVSHSERASNYAPKAMTEAGLAGDYSRLDLKRAMNALLSDRAIVADARLWPAGNRHFVTGMARVAVGI
jgi:RecA-family ATPase